MKESLSYEEYKSLVEKAPILIWRAAVTMECDYFNHIWLAFTGRTLAQELGYGWTEGVHPEDLDRCVAIYQDHFARRAVFEMEYRLRRQDGVYRWIFDRGAPLYDAAGVFTGYIGSCIDVTERVEALAALKAAQEDEIRRLQELLPICSYCKKVRNDENYWEQLESYLQQHANLMFSHGICPECEPKVREEIAEFKAERDAGSQP